MKTSTPAILLAALAASCAHGAPNSSKLPEKDTHNDWGYEGPGGPNVWHELSHNNKLCAAGKSQSPINVSPGDGVTKPVDGSTLRFEPNPYPRGVALKNLGHSVQISLDGSVFLNKWIYDIKQAHFHTPSEHRLRGEYFPVEVHFVAETAAGANAVIGFFVELANGKNRFSDYLTAILKNVGKVPKKGDVTTTEPLNPLALQYHVRESKVHQYNGSLTTPPCSENVLFNIVEKPLYIDVEEYQALKSVVKYNSRFTQNRDGKASELS
ncbi:hypothetical protein HIM_09318 [Hirsutella minnesotensis 3608]|uniref:Carbonic anhydrase n=1 Tax=Hirsutella minnesotensis 3608 TaxID=1043627 RepID=A0A0F7ZSG2_9HYPO|nr:hypothetical protein HIM_09318 [Hirsutella minnesotensis 3608]